MGIVRVLGHVACVTSFAWLSPATLAAQRSPRPVGELVDLLRSGVTEGRLRRQTTERFCVQGELTPAVRQQLMQAGASREFVSFLDSSGCLVARDSDSDSDRDGIADYLDRCANTAAGTQVDANGCPVARDSDNDGVIDANDRCANTPANNSVDVTGCPYAELPTAGASLVIRSINFRAGTAQLLPTSNAELDRIAIAIQVTPSSRWEIGGYTDNIGVPAANQRLSQQRAQAVMAYLVTKYVPAASLTAVGYGSQSPVRPNTTAAGRAQNRRVEIKRIQ